MTEHRWSGWPGAWCLDCGAEDPYEIALADGLIEFDGDTGGPADGIRMVFDPGVKAALDAKMICPEPGSKRHDPYSYHPTTQGTR